MSAHSQGATQYQIAHAKRFRSFAEGLDVLVHQHMAQCIGSHRVYHDVHVEQHHDLQAPHTIFQGARIREVDVRLQSLAPIRGEGFGDTIGRRRTSQLVAQCVGEQIREGAASFSCPLLRRREQSVGKSYCSACHIS